MSETVHSIMAAASIAIVRAWTRWHHLDTDWQSVALGFVVCTVVVLFELRIPW